VLENPVMGERIVVRVGTEETGGRLVWDLFARPGGRPAAAHVHGKTNARGIPRLLQGAVLMHEYRDVIQLASPPRAVQRAVFGVLASIGRTRGLRPAYP